MLEKERKKKPTLTQNDILVNEMEDSQLINWKALSEVVMQWVILQEVLHGAGLCPEVQWEASKGAIIWALALQKAQSAKGDDCVVWCSEQPKSEEE